MKVVDMHCDTISRLINKEGIVLFQNDLHVDIQKLFQGDYLLQNFAMFVPLGEYDCPEKQVFHLIARYYQELEKNSQWIAPVYCYKDITENSNNHKLSALLTLEEGDVIFHDLNMLNIYYRLGVRMICLTWNYKNSIGSPNFTMDNNDPREIMLRKVNTDDGLTDFGIQYIQEMERLGIIIDVSHLGDKGFYDVLKNTKKPFVASHSNARSICDVARNLDDDMIRALSKRGGVMGINYCSDFLANDGKGNIESIVNHIDHIVRIGGIDCVGLGSDFDGIKDRDDLANASYLPELVQALRNHNYDETSIAKIFHQNVLRVYETILK